MSEEKFYRCIPELNKECKKNNCYIKGGECETTIYKKYTLKGLLEEIERLKEENTILKQTMSSNSLLINENAFLKERIENKEDEKEVLKEINNIHKEMNKLPLM